MQFEAALASVLQNRPADCEILVVQPRAYDDPYELGCEVRFVEASASATTVDLINLGVELATGTVVHILTCDVEVTDGWTDAIWSHFADRTVGAVSPLVVRADGGRVVSRGVRYSVGGRRSVRVKDLSQKRGTRGVDGPTLAAGFYRRQMLADAAGFCREVGDELADVDLGVFMRAGGWRTVHEAGSVITFSGEVARQRPSFLRGRNAERLFWRNVCMNSQFAAYAAHTGVVLGEVLVNLLRPALAVHLLGRACAVLESSHYRQRRDQLSAVRGAACEAEPETVPFAGRPIEAGTGERVRPRSAA
jgi:hypothetical protein